MSQPNARSVGGRKGRKSFCQAGVFLSFAKKPFLKQVVWPKLKNVILGKREREKARYREREREREIQTGYQQVTKFVGPFYELVQYSTRY